MRRGQIYERTLSAQEGKSILKLVELLTKLKVNHRVHRVAMHKLMGSKPGEYRVQLYS